ENDQVFYGVMPVGVFSLAIGPVAVWTASEPFLQTYASDHALTKPIPIPKKDLGYLTRLMKLMALHFTGSTIPREEIAVANEVLDTWQSAGALEEYQLDQSENDRELRKGVDYENALLRAVQKGDTAALRSLLSGPTPDYAEIGKISDEQNKANEYLVVSVITLLTRAAVAGGAGVEASYELGDVYLKRLSKAMIRREPFLALSYQAMVEFAELVRRSKEEKSSLSYVDACKEYIEKNLRKDLQVGDIAPAIGLSRTYLSRLFHQEEGITVQQYIQKEKCRHAAQMLRYSDYSISQIAQYFGFSSQSYFGSCFQTWYGMTPNAYRKENH
ncbi:MAG: helix-turn-helix transcriptional regulator, partial [Oscillospiraceae bacterium]|nr:helix-turn-helix transcriptional regulator [Oscillospiraceae bacterium]